MKLTWRQKMGRPECPYIERWVLDLGRLGSLRLHHWLASDDHRALHDHPSDFITLVLKGSYDDVGTDYSQSEKCPDCGASGGGHYFYCKTQPAYEQPTRVEHMRPGMIRRRQAEHRHWVRVNPGGCWTLLYFWPERRMYGFWVNGKFRKRNKYFFEHGHHPCELPSPSHQETMRAYWMNEISAQKAARRLADAP